MTPAERKQRNEATKLRRRAHLELRKAEKVAQVAALDAKVAELSAPEGGE